MIKLKVSDSPDLNAIGDHEFHYDKVLIGKKNEDIIVNDPSLKDISLILNISANGVKVSLSDLDLDYTVNGKTISGERILKAGDLFAFGNSAFQLIKFEKTEKDLLPTIENNLEDIEKLPRDQKIMLNELESFLEKF